MKKRSFYVPFLLVVLIISCKQNNTENITPIKDLIVTSLPFEEIALDNLNSFKKTSKNWQIAGQVIANRQEENKLEPSNGTGVLVNLPREGEKDHLFTTFEHGDIALEVDVMMPLKSNSGIYFQGRYEVQLFDSWGIENPSFSDIGGIYERWGDSSNEGFEGYAPRINAGKAPGLWQRFKIVFHGPKFNTAGEKVKNALFKEIWLNGELIHKNVELSGPTRAAAFTDEQSKGPLMIQGDHGAVAIKNLKYKLYDNSKVALKDVVMSEYENSEKVLPSFDGLEVIREIATDTISSKMVLDEYGQNILKYSGKLVTSVAGEYLFDLKVNGGALLLINNDTIANLDGDYSMFNPAYGKVFLKEGETPFTLVYNKHTQWMRGFSLEVEGPGVEKHPLQSKESLNLNQEKPEENIVLTVTDNTITQRGFMMHEGIKRTHTIAVGLTDGMHFSYDMATASLLQVWQGDFLDVSDMWHSRGVHQLAQPLGFTVSFHGDPDFMILENESATWPNNVPKNMELRQMGYEFKENEIPVFTHKINETTITNTMVPSNESRLLKRIISVEGNKEIWHKIADGSSIEKVSKGVFIINSESYFVDFSENENLVPVIRKGGNKEELLVKIPAGDHSFSYNLIW
ncbi:MAG: hypothetical protein COA50_09615 [Flavobacteriaceae bacterium]|nr:MAG: hypothetical protein COA50_09615 [Flavobacteriaceae bacterium]